MEIPAHPSLFSLCKLNRMSVVKGLGASLWISHHSVHTAKKSFVTCFCVMQCVHSVTIIAVCRISSSSVQSRMVSFGSGKLTCRKLPMFTCRKLPVVTSNVLLIDDGPLASFELKCRSSSAYSLCTFLLQAVTGVLSLALCTHLYPSDLAQLNTVDVSGHMPSILQILHD